MPDTNQQVFPDHFIKTINLIEARPPMSPGTVLVEVGRGHFRDREHVIKGPTSVDRLPWDSHIHVVIKNDHHRNVCEFHPGLFKSHTEKLYILWTVPEAEVDGDD